MTKADRTVISVISILGISGIFAAALNPESASFEGFMNAMIAAILAGIYVKMDPREKKSAD